MYRTGAFFDLDRTLMSGSSGAQFGRAAYRAGLVSRACRGYFCLKLFIADVLGRISCLGATDKSLHSAVVAAGVTARIARLECALLFYPVAHTAELVCFLVAVNR